MKKKTTKILKRIAMLIIILGLIYAIALSYSSVKLTQAYKDLKKDGRPMEPYQVIPPLVSDTQNAALLYESAASFLRAQPAPDGNLLNYMGALSDKLIKETIEPDKLTELKQLFAQEEVIQALSMVEQGTQRDSCRFALNYDDGLSTLLPHIPGLRNLIFIGCAKALIEAKTGNPDNAWDTIAIQLKFTDALWTEPIFVSQLVRMRSIRLSCKAIMKLCEIAAPSEQQYIMTQNLLKDLDDIRPIITAIDGDRLIIGEWAFNMPKLELIKQEDLLSQDSPSYKLGIIRTLFKPTFLSDRAAYLRFMHEATRFIEHPNSHKQFYILEKEIEKKRHSVTRMLMLPMSRVKNVYHEMVAELRITQAGMALQQHKQKHGTFPDTLEAIKSQNINDPFSDGQLIYKSEGQNFILYSIGPDKKDNNGSPKQDKQEKDWDIVWNFPAK